MAFLYLALDWAVVPEGDSGPPPPCESGIHVSFLVGGRQTLETMGVTDVLRETSFDVSLGGIAYCQSQDVNGSRCSSN